MSPHAGLPPTLVGLAVIVLLISVVRTWIDGLKYRARGSIVVTLVFVILGVDSAMRGGPGWNTLLMGFLLGSEVETLFLLRFLPWVRTKALRSRV